MANGRFSFCSDYLKRLVEFQIVLPNDLPKEWTVENPHYRRPMKTLFLLHGYTGNSMDWMTGSAICELAGNYNLAVVCPAGENSFYLDGPETGRKYASYVGEELVQYVRNTFGLAGKMEDTYIGGLSMGAGERIKIIRFAVTGRPFVSAGGHRLPLQLRCQKF